MRNSVRSVAAAPYDGSRWMKSPCAGASDQTSSFSRPSMSGFCASVILNAIARKLSGSTLLMSKVVDAPWAKDTGADAASSIAVSGAAASHDLNIEGAIVPSASSVHVIKCLAGDVQGGGGSA